MSVLSIVLGSRDDVQIASLGGCRLYQTLSSLRALCNLLKAEYRMLTYKPGGAWPHDPGAQPA